MATYTIVSPKQRDAGFLVTIVGDDGARNTVLGFGSLGFLAVTILFIISSP